MTIQFESPNCLTLPNITTQQHSQYGFASCVFSWPNQTRNILNTCGTGNNFLTLIPTVNLSNSLPFFSSGGSGGGSGNVGGSGANGNYGSGGGGAGNARTAVVNNFGGRGGDGIVIITCI